MIKLTPVEDGHQQVVITADEPVTVSISLIPAPGNEAAHITYVYRGVLAEDDHETEPVAIYDGSMGHAQNVEILL